MTLTKTLQTAETVVGIICLGSMFVIICANVVMRYVASDPIFWAEELSNFLFVWAGFLSCAYILAEDRHIRVTPVCQSASADGPNMDQTGALDCPRHHVWFVRVALHCCP